MTEEEINNMKYKVCCPLCDNDKCVRGTDKCEAEMWAKQKGVIQNDCISRQAIKEMLIEEWTKYTPMELDISLSFILDKISVLPPVTSQPKTGRWIVMSEGFSPYGCSECGSIQFVNSKYCPNCGAKMEVEG